MTLQLPSPLRHPWKFLKVFAPKSLFGRALVILITPLLLVQVVVSYVYLERHLDSILSLLADNIAGDMQFVVAVNEHPNSHITQAAAQHLNLKLEWIPEGKLTKFGRRKSGWLYDFMGDALDAHLKNPYYLTLDRSSIHVHIQMSEGILKISVARKRLFNRTSPLVLIWSTVSALFLLAVASLFMRNQIKPLWSLARAAEKFGKGQDPGHLRPQGAIEVRKAAQAFNIMRDRIQKQIQERTELLAGVSHDLRTPLTRMKLQIALIKETPAIKDLEQDVSSMQSMVEGFLDFARGAEDEQIQNCSVTQLLSEIQQEFNSPTLTITCPESLFWNLKYSLIKRCLTNLLLNASRYGSQIWITVQPKKHVLEIWIDDDGPGIPESERDNVFRPFYRLDESRSNETGGTGLGLSIARDAVRRHGGQIWLSDSPFGGLRVVARLPK